MNDIDIFKYAASKSLPKNIYQQLLPHLDALVSNYEVQRSEEADMGWKEVSDARQLREILEEFANFSEQNWQAFARAHWPDIDKTFDLEAMYKRRNRPPTSPPWVRNQPPKCVQPPWKKS
jgi:hypothetical protein